MKRIMKTLALVAVAAMGLTACQNEYDDEQIVANDSVVVTFVADAADDTRTSVDTSGDAPVFAWGENETFAVLEQTDALAEATSVTFKKEDGKAKIEAEFATNAGKDEYNYVTVYPESGYVSAENIGTATLALPAEQTMAESSYDPAADLMVSEVVNTDAQPTVAQSVRFTRLAAVAKMTLKNLALEAGDAVESVTFTAEGKVLAGTFTTDLAAPAVAEAEGSNSVTVATTSSDVVYFTVLPTTIAVGESFTVTIVTNRHLYIKEVTIPQDKKALEFEAGNVTRFSLNMQGVAPSDKWVLVKDASTLAEGDVVIIATNGLISSKYYAMSTTQNTNYRGYTEIAKYNDFVINPSNSVQQFTLVKRYEDKVAFDFYDGVNKGFIYAASSGNRYLKTQPYYDNNTLFYIEVDNTGVATVTAKDSEYSYNQLMFYDASYSTDYFACVGTTKAKPISLYKLVGAQGEVPVVAANVTVSGDAVVITEDGAAEATAISTELVKFNYVGDWTITASATVKNSEEPATWLTLAYDATNNCLTYTAEKNNDAKREATITITASLEGQTDLTWTVNVTQKGAPLDITIEEFGKLAADPNQTYRLTGKVTKLAENNNTKGYTLEDENQNQAFINYLKTEANESVWGHDDIELQLGDIVTVTAVPTGSKKGGSSTNPAIYKGHYRLTATAVTAADYTGGDVTIEVETSSNGNVTLPTTPVKGSMSDYDFADFAYTDGSDTATVTFNSENTTSDAREAEVTFTYGLASATVVAKQGINPANKKGYELVTDASTLAVGDEVIIVAKNADKALGVNTSSTAITSISNFPSAAIAKSGNVIYDAVEAGVQTFTIANANTDGKFALQFTYKTSSYYLYIGSSTLKGYETLGNYTKLSFAIDANGVATITNSAGTAAIITYNATSTKFGSTKVSSVNAEDTTNDIAIYRMQK